MDRKNGIVAIPIEKAMALMAADPNPAAPIVAKRRRGDAMRACRSLLVAVGSPVALARRAGAETASSRCPRRSSAWASTRSSTRALPLQLAFKDDRGRDVTLGSYFRPGRPVVLTLNYYRCPMLCTLELNGLVDALKGLAWSPGDEFTVVTVSFDPRETTALARAKKLGLPREPGKARSAEAGWHFLTGSAASIEALTSAVGFSTEYDQRDRPVRARGGRHRRDPRGARVALPLRRALRAGRP